MMDDKDNDIDAPEERLIAERVAQHRLIGFLLLPIAFFPLLSLLTYDWRDISWLSSPPQTPPANLIGVVGAWSVFAGYTLIGLAVWVIPALTLLFSGMLIYGRIMKISRKVFWMALFIAALCGLIQLGSGTAFAGTLTRLNLPPNAGGAIGYWLMTCLLERWFSPFGGGMLMVSVMLLALVMTIGMRRIFSGLGRLTGLCRRDRGAPPDTAAAPADPSAPADQLSPRERKKLEKEALKEAARKAREEARAAREEERQRKKAEKAETFEKKQEERQERLRQKQEAARQALLAKQNGPAQTDAIRKRAEEARRAAALANEQPETPKPAPLPAEAPAAVPAPPPAASSSAAAPAAQPVPDEYPLPPISLLDDAPGGKADPGNVAATAQILVDTLAQFKVPVEVVGTTPGPVVTQYELRPAPDIKVERIASLTANLQMALAAKTLRVLAPIPGKNAVGIEIPNRRAVPVTFGEVIRGEAFQRNKCEIPLVLGKDVAGRDLIYDLAKAPHLLVAGATGSGKSVCLNSIIIGLLMCRKPEQLRLILVDPKRVEFVPYNGLPHLLVPVVNDAKKVAFALRWALMEMDKRYRLLQRCKCRNIVAYNERPRIKQGDLFESAPVTGPDAAGSPVEDPDILPYIVIIVDEVADIMAAVGKEVEPAINRLAALSRAVGIHLILATQRPSVDVITGTIKSNIPGRIAFKVSQANDSRTILDSPGAEELLGKGDMLFLREGSQLTRAQGAWLTDEEINRVVSFVKEHCRPCYDQALSAKIDKIQEDTAEDILAEDDKPDAADTQGGDAQEDGEDGDEEMINNALEVIRRTQRASTTMLQRRLKIGYTRAARIMDTLEEKGIVGPQQGSGTREILVDLDHVIPSNSGFDEAQAKAMNSGEAGEPPPQPEAPAVAPPDGAVAQSSEKE
jgi:S-DNA-T family DNA segregation ATPase FtsK/SpoIIIE